MQAKRFVRTALHRSAPQRTSRHGRTTIGAYSAVPRSRLCGPRFDWLRIKRNSTATVTACAASLVGLSASSLAKFVACLSLQQPNARAETRSRALLASSRG